MSSAKTKIILEKKALNLLFHPEIYPGMISRNSDHIKFLIWINDTLGDFTSYTFFLSNDEGCIRRVVWKQRTPYKLKEPETYGSERAIPMETASIIMEEFSKFNLKEFENNSKNLCIDGIKCGISSEDNQISWIYKLPTLIQLAKWHEKTLEQFSNYF